MKQYYTIHEISQLYNLGKDSLRYYEKLGILCPKRADNGYRMYTRHDIYRLNVIKDMKSLGFSMSQIHQYLENRSVDNSIHMFEQELEMIERKIQELMQMQQEMQACLQELKKTQNLSFDEFKIVEYPDRKCVTWNEPFETEDDVDYMLTKLARQYEPDLLSVANFHTGLIIDIENEQYISTIIMEDSFQKAEYVWPAGKYLVGNIHGKFDYNFYEIRKMKKYAQERGLTCARHALELFIIDSHETSHAEEYISQFQIRLED